MSLIALPNNTLVLGLEAKLLFLHLNSENGKIINSWEHNIEAAAPILPSKVKKYMPVNDKEAKDEELEDNQKPEETEFELNNMAVAPSGKLLGLTMRDKTIYLFEIYKEELKLLSRRKVARNTSVVKFFPDSSQMLVADKTGDLFVFDCQDFNAPGKWILGHLSQVLDVVMNQEKTFVLSCDRDEKIKVSKWPEADQIETFCLGHREFVSSMQFIQHGNKELLVTGSGDCSIKIWEYEQGKCLHTIQLDWPVAGIFVQQNISEFQTVLAVLTRRPDKLIFIGIKTGENHSFQHVILHETCFPKESFIISGILDGACFWSALKSKDDGVELKKLNVKTYELNEMEELNQLVMTHFKGVKYELGDVLENLYKKKFDNVIEYQEKKRRRIEEEISRKEGTQN